MKAKKRKIWGTGPTWTVVFALVVAFFLARQALLTPELGERVRLEVQDAVTKGLGEPLSMKDLRVDLFGRVVIEDVSLGSGDAAIFHAEKLNVSISLMSLLRGEKNPGKLIKSIIVVGPDVKVVRLEDGTWNYFALFKSASGGADGGLPEFGLRMKNGHAVFEDRYAEKPYGITYFEVNGLSGDFKLLEEKVMLLSVKGTSCTAGGAVEAAMRFDLRAGWDVKGTLYDMNLSLVNNLVNSDSFIVTGTAKKADVFIQSAYTIVGHAPNFTWTAESDLTGATLALNSYGVTLENVSSHVNVVNASVSFSDGAADLAGGRVTFDGSILSRGSVFLAVDAELDKVPVKSVGALADMIPEASGVMSGSASLKGTSKSPELTMSLTGEDIKYSGVYLGAGSADVSLSQSVFAADNIKLTVGASTIEGQARMEVGAETPGAMAVSATLKNAPLKNLLGLMNASIEGVEGGLVSGALFYARKDRESAPEYFGTLSSGGFSYYGVEPGELVASFHFNDDVLSIENLTLKGENEKFSARGSIVGGEELEFELSAAEARVTSLLAVTGRGDLQGSGSIIASGRVAGTVTSPSFEGSVQGGSASISAFMADGFSGAIKYADSRLELKSLDIYAGHDAHRAAGVIDFGERTMLVNASIEKTQLSELAQLAADALMLETAPPENMTGIVDATIVVKGSFDNPIASIKAVAKDMTLAGEKLDLVSIDMDYADVPVLNDGIILAGGGVLNVSGVMDPNALDLVFRGRGISVASFNMVTDYGVSSTVSFNGTIKGSVDVPDVSATVEGGQVGYRGVRFDADPVNVSYYDGFLSVEQFNMTKGDEKYSLSVRYDMAMDSLDLLLTLDGAGLNTVARYFPFQAPPGTSGRLDGTCRVFRNVGEMSGGIRLSGKDLSFGNYPIDSMSLEGKFEGNKLNLYSFVAENEVSVVNADGTVDLDKKSSAKINISAHKIELARLSGTGLIPEGFGGTADVEIEFLGEENDARMYGSFVVYDLEAYSMMFSRARGLFESDGNVLDLKDMKLIHEGGRVEVVGSVPLREGFEKAFSLRPTVEGVGIEVLNPALEKFGVTAFGGVTLDDVVISGSIAEPALSGSVSISDATVNVKGFSEPLRNVNGKLRLSKNMIDADGLAGTYNDAPVAVKAHVEMKGLYPENFHIYPDDISDVYLEYGELFKGRVSVTGLELSRSEGHTRITGREGKNATVTLRDGVFVIPGTVSASEAAESEPTDPIRMSGLVINVADKMVIRNQRNSLRFEPTGQLLLGGSVIKPEVKGWLSSARGHMRYLGNTFKMGENTLIGFYSIEGVGMVPVFYTEATTRVASSDITMEVSGPMVDVNAFPVYRELCGGGEAELGLNSAIGVPQMSMGESGDIVVPVCPRVVLLAYEDNDAGGAQLSTQQIMQKLTHTESFISGDGSPDALRAEAFSMFTPYVGSVVEKGINLENFTINLDPNEDLLVQLEKRIYSKFYIRYERLFSRTVQETLEARYKFRNRSFLKWGIDQDNQTDFQVEYRLRF